MPRTTLTSKGQLTIPKELRSRLSLESGDRIDFTIDECGRLIGVPVAEDPLEDLFGSLSHLAGERPVSIEEMDRAIRDRHRESAR